MEETIDFTIVYAKTPKGVAEINARSGALTLQARRVLIMIDGRRPVAELMAVVRTGEFEGIMSALETQSMIEKVDVAVPPRNYEDEDFADTISLLQENAAALRAMPQLTPAEIAAAQGRPATISVEQRVEPRAEQRSEPAVEAAATIAARAVATASAPRTVEAAMRRPPTVSAPLSANDMVAGSTRPGTMNGTVRVPDHPVRRPPTLSSPTSAHAQEHAGAAVEAPSRPAPAPARAEPAPAAPAAATAPARTLEEEKRHAVSELYSVLGPYGEQPAAKLQECATLEALREQIKQAGKRVATFRGEKAAQDYLRAIGHG
jgi:hypothetical protein